MAKKPGLGPGLSAGELAALRATIVRRPPHIFTDPIDMEHILEEDFALGKQLTAQRLETFAEVQRVIAEGAVKAAKLLR